MEITNINIKIISRLTKETRRQYGDFTQVKLSFREHVDANTIRITTKVCQICIQVSFHLSFIDAILRKCI